MRKEKREGWGMGTTFWTSPKHPTVPSHLHIIVSDPSKKAEEIAVVNVTTLRDVEAADLSCILEPGDHPAIRRKSYVGYRRAWMLNVNALDSLREGGQIHRAEPMRADVLRRVQLGAMKSPGTPARVKGLLAEQGLV